MLDDQQLAAARELLRSALGSGEGSGYQQVAEVVLANGLLGSGLAEDYFLAIVGEPSESAAWQLQFSGHHVAVNLVYEGGAATGLSPFFIGVEPLSWTADGATYAPLAVMKDGIVAAIGSLDPDQLVKAQRISSFDEVVLGAGVEGFYPDAPLNGVNVAELSLEQQQLVLASLEPWISIGGATAATEFRTRYESELGGTYLSVAGDPTLEEAGSYVRITGPSVWLEIVVQPAVFNPSKVHYHTVFRDRLLDYGGQFSS